MHIKVDDTVEVIAGKDRAVRARVLKVIPTTGKVIVEGVNKVFKHVRRSQQNPQGGRLSKEMPLQISNVMLVCQSCGKATRTGSKIHDDGSKTRYCKKCGADQHVISPPKN
ncbi:MAG: 50S ribosomal protein L24 [Blastopirellula sp.]|nr:MAG: 50S ribosomal protein L24 [Blastopirellula sp.]